MYKHFKMIKLILENENIPRQDLKAIEDPSTHPDHLTDLLNKYKHYPHIAYKIGMNPNIKLDDLAWAASHVEDPLAVLENPAFSLMSLEDPSVHKYFLDNVKNSTAKKIAQHPNIPLPFQKLLSNVNEYGLLMVNRLSENPNLHPEIKKQIIDNFDKQPEAYKTRNKENIEKIVNNLKSTQT